MYRESSQIFLSGNCSRGMGLCDSSTSLSATRYQGSGARESYAVGEETQIFKSTMQFRQLLSRLSVARADM